MNRSALLLALAPLFGGCPLLDAANGIGGGAIALPPTSSLSEVALIEAPTTAQLAAYYCDASGSVLPSVCKAFFGPIPRRTDLRFVFETVFDLGNPNSFPIPLIEMLLALDVFEGKDQAELAAVCVSFCNPDEGETCTGQGGEEACRAADKEIRDIEDFVPTVDDLVNIAVNAANGTLDDNLSFRTIPARSARQCHAAAEGCEARTVDGQESLCCGEDCEALEAGSSVDVDDEGRTCLYTAGRMQARIRFELGLDATLKILEEIADQAIDTLIMGESPDFSIPYQATGTLFFDVPVLGRFALEFGPLKGTWELD